MEVGLPVLTLHPQPINRGPAASGAVPAPSWARWLTRRSACAPWYFDAATASVQAQQVQVQQMRLMEPPSVGANDVQRLRPVCGRTRAADWPLYTLSAEQQQQLSRLHLAVGDITVHADGLRIVLHAPSS